MHTASSVELADPHYLRPAAAARCIGIAESTLWDCARNDPTFPTPIRLSPRVTVFRRASLVAWVEARAASGNKTTPRCKLSKAGAA